MPTIPTWPGANLSALHFGMGLTTVSAVLALLLVVGGTANPAALALCALLGQAGLFLYERAYVRAGQLPPLS